MENIMRKINGFSTLFTVGFLLFFAGSSVGYVSSSYLGSFLSPTLVTLLFVALAIVNIIVLAIIPPILRAVGVLPVFVWLVPIAQLAIFLYGLSKDFRIVVIFFIVQGVALMLLSYLMDLYVENITDDETKTGNVRSLFLFAANLATLLAPLAIIFLVINDYYPPLFALAAVALAPVFVLSLTKLKKLDPRPPQESSFFETLGGLWTCHHSIARVIGAHFILQMFFTWSSIYAPLFLIENGYSWQVIGGVFMFALIPYLLLEIPVGILADKHFGEVEMMTIGFVILAGATAALSFVPVTLIVFWALAFFATRIGAALIEITTEAYFFKQVDEEDASLVSLFRMLRSFGLLGGSLAGLILLPLVGFQYLFAAFGAIILLGIPFALTIKDTK